MTSHTLLIHPGIKFVDKSAAVVSEELSFENLGLQPEDFIHYSLARTFSTIPTLPEGWNEITSPWYVSTPIYVVHWWKYFKPGDTDPYPSNPGTKRLRIYRNAKIKVGSVVNFSVNSGTSMHIPSIINKKNIFHEWAVFDVHSRQSQSNIGSIIPENSIKRYSTTPTLINHVGGDNGGLNDGWSQYDFVQTSSPTLAISYILEPRF